MPDFSLQLTKPAASDLDGVPDPIRVALIEGISTLQGDPFPSGQTKKKLKGFKFALYRLRVGNYRVLYCIDERLVTIMRIVDRKDLEKTIKRLRLLRRS